MTHTSFDLQTELEVNNIPDVIWIILLLVQYTHQGSNTILVRNLLWCIWS
jgi:hypothetical protein